MDQEFRTTCLVPAGAAGRGKFAIIGGGLIGMSTALELKRLAPHAEVRVLEKESRVGRHQSTHNSGVLHAGLYYRPGSLKARLAVQGIRRLVAFCRQ
ncbi:MAG: FAD-dependent oxidoreductase, partial [Opitutae bacterium]|nr:FAD-dependent oxidoreductase [Opitutae bacterium]